MANALFAYFANRTRAAMRRQAISLAYVLVGAVFALFALAGLFAALFFALEPGYGPMRASLIVAAVAFLLTLLATAPLWLPRRRPPPPPDPTLAELLALASKGNPGAAPSKLAIVGVIAALALGLLASRKSEAER